MHCDLLVEEQKTFHRKGNLLGVEMNCELVDDLVTLWYD